jgi:hypothetical protein
MTTRSILFCGSFMFACALAAIALVLPGCNDAHGGGSGGGVSGADATQTNATSLIDEGRETFRFDTFGSEVFWGDTLHLHQAIAGVDNGGVGPGLSPQQALALGLKVDSDALGSDLRDAIAGGHVDLTSPATTIELLRHDAVVGVRGFFDSAGALRSIGIQCALCHSTVDDSFEPSMGRRRDGWPNRDLDVGSIIALAPNLMPVANLLQTDEETVRMVLHTWGPGKFDAELFLDGQAFQPDGTTSAATLIPPALGLLGVNLHTWTGWGSITYWNAFVANLEMHGQGNFFDPRLDDARKFPVAARAGFGHVETKDEDKITPKLAALQFYQLALPIPTPPAGSFDAPAAARGEVIFKGIGECYECHVPPLYTEPGWNMHEPSEIGVDDFQASRSPDGRLRTSPLRALFIRNRGGFFHDGRFATLADVVDHYDTHFQLGLTDQQKHDLVEFLKSL